MVAECAGVARQILIRWLLITVAVLGGLAVLVISLGS
jgi:hypothetical protein